jgi:ADP-ribose pyrophosphatase
MSPKNKDFIVSKYGPRRQYLNLGEFGPEDVFPHVTEEETRRGFRGIDGKSYSVRMNSDRYFCFNRDPACVCCGIQGEVLILELQKNQKDKNPHFNFYARHNGDKQLILMTKDHIVPKSLGGADHRSNLQTMCTICNNLKGGDNLTLEELRERRRKFDMLQITNLRVLGRSKFLHLYEMFFRQHGIERRWTFASRKSREVCEKEFAGKIPVKPDAVMVVATVRGECPQYLDPYIVQSPPRLVITKEFRPPLGDYEYAMPAGLMDADEMPADTAKRELFEETGLTLTEITSISPVLYSSAGMTNESVQIVSGIAEGQITNEHTEESEDIETLLLSVEEVKDLVNAKGKFEGAKISAKVWPILLNWIQR